MKVVLHAYPYLTLVLVYFDSKPLSILATHTEWNWRPSWALLVINQNPISRPTLAAWCQAHSRATSIGRCALHESSWDWLTRPTLTLTGSVGLVGPCAGNGTFFAVTPTSASYPTRVPHPRLFPPLLYLLILDRICLGAVNVAWRGCQHFRSPQPIRTRLGLSGAPSTFLQQLPPQPLFYGNTSPLTPLSSPAHIDPFTTIHSSLKLLQKYRDRATSGRWHQLSGTWKWLVN